MLTTLVIILHIILFTNSSGGKDSCYNMMKCVAAGHEIVALANLRPAEKGPSMSSDLFQIFMNSLLNR